MKISRQAKMQQEEVANDILEDDRVTLKMSEQPSEKSCYRFENFSTTIQQQLKTTMDYIRSPSNCANMNQASSRGPLEEHRADVSLLQRMCTNMRATQRGGSNKSDAKKRGNLTVNRFVKRSTASYTREGLFKPTFICLLIMMALVSSLHATHATEVVSSPQGYEAAKPNQGHDSKPNSNERVDLPTSKSDSQSSPAALSSEKSIVASLSSAVATAAAAAAVAAAQNSLSTNDARSLASGSRQRKHAQAQRSPGLNLAIKLVDTIPEVPYNILHNMKKLDHAAPFYNVPNKLSGSTTKESTQNFLSTALASGNLGGAAEQLSAIFRSPLWKRISDGYGEFASEFRSRFRPPGAAPMKGPTSSTSKILRDISVPALLMLLASSVSGTDWRPVRTRRKSFVPVDIPAAALPSGLASSPALLINPNLKDSQYYQSEAHQHLRPNMDPLISEASENGPWIDQATPNRLQPNQQADANSMVRMNEANDVRAASSVVSAANTWTAAQAGGAVQAGAISSVGQDQNQQYYTYAPAMANAGFAQPQPVKRSDEIIATDSGYSSSAGSFAAAKPAPGQQRSSLFSSLTSDLALGQGKLMTKLFNANVASDRNAYRMMSLADSFNRVSPIKRDQLSDKQRYSLIEPNDGEYSSGGANKQLHQSTEPFSLSELTNAVTSMINKHSSAGSSSSSQTAAVQQPGGKPSLFSRASLQHLIGDKTINHSDSFLRRQPQQAANFAEQRDLTKLLPESWREVVKRTMSTVQQQANVQWKSIEGQLANWVQDKLKTVAAAGGSASPSGSSASSGSSGSSTSSAPASMANMLASVSSTALNILGLQRNTNSSAHSHSSAEHQLSSTAKVDKSSPAAGNEMNAANQRGKLEKNASTANQQPAKGALAGVASVLVKSLTNRQSSSTATPSSPLSSPPKPSVTDSTTLTATNDAPSQAQSLKVDNAAIASSSSNSVASQYPTLTGAQPESQSPTKDSSGAASVASSS